jgi:hypothetical protein
MCWEYRIIVKVCHQPKVLDFSELTLWLCMIVHLLNLASLAQGYNTTLIGMEAEVTLGLVDHFISALVCCTEDRPDAMLRI